MSHDLADNRRRSRSSGPHRVALAAALFTFPLLLVGGTVSVFRVGMAVPDWPTTFGINMFLYDFTNASWGVFVEHGHRLYGSAVGLACIILAVWFAVAERSRWLKLLGLVALLAVIGQGVLGGYRVRHNSTELAWLHGSTAYAFFGLLVSLVVVTGRRWAEVGDRPVDPSGLRWWSLANLGLVYGQAVLGAEVRHYGVGVLTHASLAMLVVASVAGLTWRSSTIPSLRPSSRAMVLAVAAQVALGVAAWWLLRPFDGTQKRVTNIQLFTRLGHQGTGALLLAASVVYGLRAWRSLVGRPSAVASRRLEAVA